jgi:hypothetical protein
VPISIRSIKLIEPQAPAKGAAHRTPTRARPLRPERLVWVFLAHARSTAKALAFEGWKSLDFLGFSRPKQAFSMGYAGFSLKENSWALLPAAVASVGTGASGFGMQKSRIGHWSSLTYFMIFSNKSLPSIYSYCDRLRDRANDHYHTRPRLGARLGDAERNDRHRGRSIACRARRLHGRTAAKLCASSPSGGIILQKIPRRIWRSDLAHGDDDQRGCPKERPHRCGVGEFSGCHLHICDSFSPRPDPVVETLSRNPLRRCL